MSIKAYVGRQGSGKSYEVCSVVILGALASGRRVVSNIAGLNFDVMREYLIKKGVSPSEIGELVTVSHEDVLRPEFFRTDKDIELAINSFLQAGDLLALDEIWRFWPKRKAISDRTMNFFRMHRHMVDSYTRLSCEVVLITQSIRDIHPDIASVIEETYRMTKHTKLGMAQRYLVQVYSSTDLRSEPLNIFQKSYQPVFFPMYQSHSGAGEGVSGIEKNVDSRGNILSGPLFKLVLPIGLIIFAACFYGLWGFFHPLPKKALIKPVDSTVQLDSAGHPVLISPASPTLPQVSTEWRIIGYYIVHSNFVLLLRNSSGSIRYVRNPHNYHLSGLDIGSVFEDQIFTSYGAQSHQSDKLIP